MKWFKSFRKPLTKPLVVEPHDSLKEFTPRAQKVLTLAREEAARFHHHFVGTEHLLLGLISLGDGVAVTVLKEMGVDLQTVRLEVEKYVGRGPDEKIHGFIPYTPRVKKVLALADKERKALNHIYLGTEHILLGLIREGDGVAARVLQKLGVAIDVVRQNVLKELDPNYSPPAEDKAVPQKESEKSQRQIVDISKRYDVYCREGDHEIVYRNALFKGIKTLFQKRESDVFSEYLELEQADGRTIFIARSSLVKFSEQGTPPNP